MTILNLLNNVDRSESNRDEVELEAMCNALFIENSYGWLQPFSERVHAYFLSKWICTDTWVGLKAIYFDDEPVAISYKPFRKTSENFWFVSSEVAEKLRDFILSLIDSDGREYQLLDSFEFGRTHDENGYRVAYTSQLLTDTGYFEGKPCKINESKVAKGVARFSCTSHVAPVIFPDGTEQDISMLQFYIPYNLKKE